MKKIFDVVHNVIRYFVVALLLIPIMFCYWVYTQVGKLFKKNEK